MAIYNYTKLVEDTPKITWIYHPETSMFDPECYVCSNCRGMVGLEDKPNECPHCHAIMEEV